MIQSFKNKKGIKRFKIQIRANYTFYHEYLNFEYLNERYF